MQSHVVELASINQKRLSDLAHALRLHRRKPLSELLVRDLVLFASSHIPITGVYAFFEGEAVVYVGKCSSRSFIERIPSHFDTRKSAWMNQLISKMAGALPRKHLMVEAKHAFENYSLLLIPCEPKITGALENVLRVILEPRLNSKAKKLDMTLVLADII